MWLPSLGTLFNSVSGYAITSAAHIDNTSGSNFLSRTFGTATSTQEGFLSWWIAIKKQGSELDVLSANATGVDDYYFQSDLQRFADAGSGTSLRINSVFRDYEWMHCALSLKSTEATAADRDQLYINGVLQTSFVTYTTNATLNSNYNLFNAVIHRVGSYNGSAASGDFLFADFLYLDSASIQGGDLTIDQVCEINNGNPEPVDLSPLYSLRGAEGFHLKFNGDATDSSGNGNDWTENGTITYVTNTPTDVYATYQALDAPTYKPTYTNGNRTVRSAGTTNQAYPAKSSLAFDVEDTKGFYFRVLDLDGNGLGQNWNSVGIIPYKAPFQPTGGSVQIADSVSYLEDGTVRTGGSIIQTYPSYGQGNYINIAVKNGSVWFGKNGVWNGDPVAGTGAAITGLTGKWQLYSLMFLSLSGVDAAQTYDATDDTDMPTGFKVLAVANLPEFTGGDLSNALLMGTYAGTGAIQTISFEDLQGNPVTLPTGTKGKLHIKAIDSATSHVVVDSVRGANKEIYTNNPSQEYTRTDSVTAFSETGFTIGADATTMAINQSGVNYVWWFEVAGVGTETDNNGTITSTVSAGKNLSIVTYTGNGMAGATVGHRGTQDARVPKFIVVKGLTNAFGWFVYHTDLGATLRLDMSSTAGSNPSCWNNTEPTSSVFSLSDSTFPEVNASGVNYVAYVYYDEPDTHCVVSKFEGNSSADGAFNYLGGEPALIDFKKSSSTSNWLTFLAKLLGYNPDNNALFYDTADVMDTADRVDLVGLGTKGRTVNNPNDNGTWICRAYVKNKIGPTTMPRGR